MTINIALATFDAIILGCDSLSSIVEYGYFPIRSEFAKDAEGNLLLDANGNLLYSQSELQAVPTNVFGGVSKIFSLYEDGNEQDGCETSVAAVTSGLALLQGVTIAEQVKRFKRRCRNDAASYTSVEQVATAFRDFIRDRFDQQYADIPTDHRQYLSSPAFIVAGYGKDDEFGRVFDIDIGQGFFHERFHTGDHSGLCWAGQSDYVERLVRGVDQSVIQTATRQMAEAIDIQREITIGDVSSALEAAGISLPADLELPITEHAQPTIPWDRARAPIAFGNLSTQYAIDFVEMLVNVQAGMQRFAHGIAGVGGRTHIGVLKHSERFRMLNEPELHHRHTGYGDEP